MRWWPSSEASVSCARFGFGYAGRRAYASRTDQLRLMDGTAGSSFRHKPPDRSDALFGVRQIGGDHCILRFLKSEGLLARAFDHAAHIPLGAFQPYAMIAAATNATTCGMSGIVAGRSARGQASNRFQ